MKKTIARILWAIAIGLFVLLIIYTFTSGITGFFVYSFDKDLISQTDACKPMWSDIGLFSTDQICKEMCEKVYSVSNFMIDNSKCFCDTNNCYTGE